MWKKNVVHVKRMKQKDKVAIGKVKDDGASILGKRKDVIRGVD